MAKERVAMIAEEEVVSIVKGWARISEYQFNGLSEQEKAQFDKAQFAEEQAKKTKFVLGEPIRQSFWVGSPQSSPAGGYLRI